MRQLRRLGAPAVLLAALVAIELSGPDISAGLGISGVFNEARSAIHFAFYLAIAWLLSRASNLLLSSLRPRSRPMPKLIKDLVSGLLFLVAIVSGVMLMLGHGAGGALAGSGVMLALMGFAIRNIVADNHPVPDRAWPDRRYLLLTLLFPTQRSVTSGHNRFIGFAGWSDDTHVAPILAGFRTGVGANDAGETHRLAGFAGHHTETLEVAPRAT